MVADPGGAHPAPTLEKIESERQEKLGPAFKRKLHLDQNKEQQSGSDFVQLVLHEKPGLRIRVKLTQIRSSIKTVPVLIVTSWIGSDPPKTIQNRRIKNYFFSLKTNVKIIEILLLYLIGSS